MKRIGIVTFHRSYNYGSALQAYALQKYINKKSIGEAKVVDFIMPYNFKQYKLFQCSAYFKRPYKIIGDLIYLKRNYKRKASFEKFVKEYIPLTEKKYFSCLELEELNEQFDMFICGSDQIWNLECTNGVEPAYFLRFASEGKGKIAYAPSIAHLNFSENLLCELKDAITSFQEISIREESSIDMLKKLTDQRIETVLDPTFLLESKDYEELLDKKGKSEYIFVYMLEFNQELISYVNKLTTEKRMKIIYISKKRERKYSNAINAFGCSPLEFLEYLYNAKYVVTNSFHATVFSLIFEKQFCTFKTMKSFSRMQDLLIKIGANKRLYDIDFKIDDKIDFTAINERLQTLRMSSINYLERNCSDK